MPYFTDQAGRSVEIKSPPTKIISLVPSQTELLFDLGLDESVIGITKFCIHPDHWFRTKHRVGGTKNPNLQLIYQLQPDLIIGNKEENRKEDIDILAENFPVWLSDINNLDDALQMIDVISRITATTDKGQLIIINIRDSFGKQSQSSEQHRSSNQKFKVCYLIWQDPYIAVGNNTFIHSMMQECGFENVFAHESRYPTTTAEAITAKNCDFIFLSTEPYPFTEKHVKEIKSLFPGSIVMLVDGELFSWYGSRLTRSAPYFQTLINKLQDAAGTS
ncbi:ABC transporter substrate-binding protein [Flavitalea sp.]|nr:helical backbone metal receptor [Flavitalea sp.]